MYKRTLDSQLLKSTSTNDHLNSYHSEENEEQDATHFPNDVKQSESEEHQRTVVDRLASSSFEKRSDTQAVPLVKIAATNGSEILGNSYRSVFINTHSQSKEKNGFEPENNTTNLIKDSSLTDKRNKLTTPGPGLKSSMIVTEPENAVPSNTKGPLNATVTGSGIKKQSTVYVVQNMSTKIAPLTQEIINSIAANMKVRFEVLEGFHRAVITLLNNGSEPIERSLWSMFVCITTGMELGHLVHKTEGYILPNTTSIKLTHLNGCSYKVEPTKHFKAILPGKSLEFMVHIGPTMARSDLGPRWYIAAEGLEPRTISNTANEALDFVFFPNRSKSWDSFANNDVVDLGNAPLLVIPTPSQITGLNATRKLSIDENWIVLGEPGLEDETSFLAGKRKKIWYYFGQNLESIELIKQGGYYKKKA